VQRLRLAAKSSASSHGTIDGVQIALEGDAVSCPACKAQGKIQCIGPRIPETWNGKNVALENDLCVCGCPSPPRLVPNQSLRYQTDSEAESETSTTAVMPSSTSTLFNDKYVLVDEETNAPLNRTEYAIKRANGQIEFGTTDEKGHTHLLAATAQAESIEIYV
jgi:hypothetical protein